MRILLPLDNPYGGGIARVARGLAGSLPHQLSGDEELVVSGGVAGLAPTPHLRILAPDPSPRSKVRRALANQTQLIRPARQVDLVHMADHRAPLLTRTPFTLTVHDLAFLDHPEWFPPAVVRYKRTFLRLSLLRGPRAVICVSEHTRSRLRAHHPSIFEKTRVPVIHSGMDAPAADRTGKSVSPPGDGDGYFLTVSSIEPRKNHLGLLTAYAAARAAGLTLRWIVVGSELYRSEPIVRVLRSADGVEVRGRASEGELERLYRGARFVATPSFEEGFGYPPLEAMTRGIPVVCSTGSGLDEVVGEAALRVPAGDAVAWAEALVRLATEPQLREHLTHVGRAQAARFTWERAAVQYADTFRAALRQ